MTWPRFNSSERAFEYYSDGFADLELAGLVERAQQGNIDRDTLIKALERLVTVHPGLLAAQAELAIVLISDGETTSVRQQQRDQKRAHSLAMNALTAFVHALPPDFEGTICPDITGNDQFYRAAHALILAEFGADNPVAAILLMQQVLAWDPSDRNGYRLQLGSEHLRNGDESAALRYFLAEDGYPPYQYDLALLLFRQEQYIEAATMLRRAIVTNGHVAELLTTHGRSLPLPIAVSAYGRQNVALEYVTLYGDLWDQTPDAIAFLRWVHMHPKALVERGIILQEREELLWRRPDGIDSMIPEFEEPLTTISPELSREIVRQRTTHEGRDVWPWAYVFERYT